jgi:hypothetical protein
VHGDPHDFSGLRRKCRVSELIPSYTCTGTVQCLVITVGSREEYMNRRVIGETLPDRGGQTIDRWQFIQLVAAIMFGGLASSGCRSDGKAKPSVVNNRRTIVPDGSVDRLGWNGFLRRWSDDIIGLLRTLNRDLAPLDKEAVELGYLGYSGASQEEIDVSERRLGVKLPPSYKEFLVVTNGWRQVAMDAESGRMFRVSEIGWFRDLYPDSLEGWLLGSRGMPDPSDDQYFRYGSDQDSITVRNRYLKEALAISQQVDAAVYLLNPRVVGPEGEWEAWFFGYSLPGANRYRSFKEMMEAEYHRVIGGLKMAIEYEKRLQGN